MKVICINGVRAGEINKNEFARIFKGDASVSDEIYEGEVYTVREDGYVLNFPVYWLYERREDCAYMKSRFAPLSEIDEKEFERNYKTELA